MCHSNCGCGKGGWRGMCGVSKTAKVLLVVGGLNWGLVGAGMLADSAESWDVVGMLLGDWPMVAAIVYVLVGVAALVKLFGCRCKTCSSHVCENCMPKDGGQASPGQM